MKTEWYKLNINDEKIIYRKIVDGLFYPLTMKEIRWWKVLVWNWTTIREKKIKRRNSSKIENYICSILCIRYIFWKVIRLYWQYQKAELLEWGEQMDTAQRIRLIRIIEKIEKKPEFSSKIGVRNTSEFISSKQSKKWMIQIITGVRRSRICYRYYLLYAWSGLLENFLYLV